MCISQAAVSTKLDNLLILLKISQNKLSKVNWPKMSTKFQVSYVVYFVTQIIVDMRQIFCKTFWVVGSLRKIAFCGSCLWCCIFKRGRVAMGAHLPLIYLFFEVQPQHSRDYFCRSHFLASILTNTCDATFSAASSSFIIIMVRVRSCRILFKLTFSKPFFWIFFGRSFYLAWWYLVSSQSELSETAPFLSRSSYEMA